MVDIDDAWRIALKNPIKNYIDKKQSALTPEEIRKREEMSQILTKELELLVGNRNESKALYKYCKDYKSFCIDKAIYIVLLTCEVLIYLILGIMETTLSQRVIVILPFICMTIPMFYFLIRIFHALSMVEVMAYKMYNKMIVKINKYAKIMLFFGVLMMFSHVALLIRNAKSLSIGLEIVYMIFILLSCMTSFMLSLHTIKFRKKMINY